MWRAARSWVLWATLFPLTGCGGTEPTADGGTDGAVCGNGLVEEGEECDLGFANSAMGKCRLDCTLPPCGDGVVQEDELCDDGAECSRECGEMFPKVWEVTVPGGIIALTVDDMGNAVASVWDGTPGEDLSFAILSFGPDGALRWERDLDFNPSVLESIAGGVLVGSMEDYDNGTPARVLQLDLKGGQVGEYLHDVPQTGVMGLARRAAGAYVLIRDSQADTSAVVALDATGEEQWRRDPVLPDGERAHGVWTHPDGGFVVGLLDTRDVLQLHGPDGMPTERYVLATAGPGEPGVAQVTFDASGEFTVAGELYFSADASASRQWIWIARYDAAANPLWERRESVRTDAAAPRGAAQLTTMGDRLIAGGYQEPEACLGACTIHGWLGIYSFDGDPQSAWLSEYESGQWWVAAASDDALYLTAGDSDTLSLIRPRFP